jgi:hypothetical protein
MHIIKSFTNPKCIPFVGYIREVLNLIEDLFHFRVDDFLSKNLFYIINFFINYLHNF